MGQRKRVFEAIRGWEAKVSASGKERINQNARVCNGVLQTTAERRNAGQESLVTLTVTQSITTEVIVRAHHWDLSRKYKF